MENAKHQSKKWRWGAFLPSSLSAGVQFWRDLWAREQPSKVLSSMSLASSKQWWFCSHPLCSETYRVLAAQHSECFCIRGWSSLNSPFIERLQNAQFSNLSIFSKDPDGYIQLDKEERNNSSLEHSKGAGRGGACL